MDSIKYPSSQQATSTQQLVIQHLPLAATIAGNISKRLPRHLDLRDIHQDARLGLVKAAAAYDVRKNVPFGAYARRRIHGAVVDGLRRDDHLTRSARARARADGGEALEHPLSLVDPDRIAGVLLEPDQFAVGAERERLLAGAIETLPGRIQGLLHAYYHSGKTMREIGYGLSVTQGRVSQLHARALKLLRAHFEQRWFHFECSVHDSTTRTGGEVVRRQAVLEKSVTAQIVARLKTVPGLVVRKRHGTPMGVSGDPDLYGSLDGKHFEIEVKRPNDPSSQPTRLQTERLREWKLAGAIAGIARSVDDALEILGLQVGGKRAL